MVAIWFLILRATCPEVHAAQLITQVAVDMITGQDQRQCRLLLSWREPNQARIQRLWWKPRNSLLYGQWNSESVITQDTRSLRHCICSANIMWVVNWINQDYPSDPVRSHVSSSAAFLKQEFSKAERCCVCQQRIQSSQVNAGWAPQTEEQTTQARAKTKCRRTMSSKRMTHKSRPPRSYRVWLLLCNTASPELYEEVLNPGSSPLV